MKELIRQITPLDRTIEKQAWEKINNKTKPVGSLGELEKIAVRMAVIRNSLDPPCAKKQLFVFAGDHGLAGEMLSAYPAEVTAQMVLNFLQGGAAINVLCRHNGIYLKIIDMGTRYDFGTTAGIIDKKVKKGTNNFLSTAAMTRDEAVAAIQSGADVFNEVAGAEGIDIIGVGEMGIGNSTSAAAIVSAITGEPPENTAGRGTGISDAVLERKIQAIRKALKLHNIKNGDALDVLSKVGGLEIGGITGTILAAAARKIPVVLDGYITAAGALLACLLHSGVKEYLFAGHKSVEKGHALALKYLGLTPLLDLGLRLGEGSGAALAMNLIEAACKILREMASFAQAKVATAL